MELGQEGWLKQPEAKVRGPIMACDQGSRWGHHCGETGLTGNPVQSGVASPGREPLPPVVESKWLVHWTSGTVRNARALQGYPSNCLNSEFVEEWANLSIFSRIRNGQSRDRAVLKLNNKKNYGFIWSSVRFKNLSLLSKINL
jgi:hypothetical protein